MIKVSRWQVFERQNDSVVICKNCESMWFMDGGTESRNTLLKPPKRCPKCSAIMVTDKNWFPRKRNRC